MATPYSGIFGNYQANIRPDPFEAARQARLAAANVQKYGGIPTSAGGLPIQRAETASRRNILPAGYATLRDYLSAGIPTLTGGARTTAKIDELNADPLKSTLFKNTITPMLASLVPSEISARRALDDRFRRSGQLQSGAYAEQSRLQESDILGNRNELVARHAGDVYSRLLQSLGVGLQAEQAQAQPFQLGTALLQALRDEGTDVTGGQYSTFDPIATAAASRGGGGSYGGGGSGGGGSTFSDESERTRALNRFGYERGQIAPPSATRPTAASPISYVPPIGSPYFTGFGYGYGNPGGGGNFDYGLGNSYDYSV